MTVDRGHVLATPGMDRHSSYVGMTRHRDGLALHYGRDDFKDDAQLARTLSRERAKDMASDYARVDPAKEFAERRGIGERVAEIARAGAEKARGIFDGLRSEEHTSELQSLMRISYAVFCLKKKTLTQ